MNDRIITHDETVEENILDEIANDDIAQEENSSNDRAFQSTPQEKIIEERGITATQQTPLHIAAPHAPQMTDGDDHQPWFSNDEADTFRSRWMEIQTKFVDEPGQAVSEGNELVSETIERVKNMISKQYTSLNDKWSNPNDLSTEDMRILMQDYRSLLNRLLD